MAAVVLPTLFDGTALYTLRCDLGAAEFAFDFKWNARDGAWFFDLATAEGVPVMTGAKVVLGWPMLRQCVELTRPLGELIAVDTANSGVEAGLLDLGDRVLLCFEDGT